LNQKMELKNLFIFRGVYYGK